MTDEKLAGLAQQGDTEAELKLFNSYRSLINKFSRGYFLVGGDVEDLIQEGMIGLYKAIKNYDPKKEVAFSTFASLCIKRQIQSAVRNATTQKNQVLSTAVPIVDEENDDLGIFTISSGLTPDEVVISKQTSEEISNTLKKNLSMLEYEVLRLYLAGLSYEQIAEKSGLAKKSIDNALSRIKKKLAFIKDKILK